MPYVLLPLFIRPQADLAVAVMSTHNVLKVKYQQQYMFVSEVTDDVQEGQRCTHRDKRLSRLFKKQTAQIVLSYPFWGYNFGC